MGTNKKAEIYYNTTQSKLWDWGRDEHPSPLTVLESFAKNYGFKLNYFIDDGDALSMHRREDFFDWIRTQNPDRPKTLKIEIVLVLELSHILRPGEDRWDLMGFFSDHGVRFIAIKEGLDTSSVAADFNLPHYYYPNREAKPFETRPKTKIKKQAIEVKKQATDGKKQATAVEKQSVCKNRLGGDTGGLSFPTDWSMN